MAINKEKYKVLQGVVTIETYKRFETDAKKHNRTVSKHLSAIVEDYLRKAGISYGNLESKKS